MPYAFDTLVFLDAWSRDGTSLFSVHPLEPSAKRGTSGRDVLAVHGVRGSGADHAAVRIQTAIQRGLGDCP